MIGVLLAAAVATVTPPGPRVVQEWGMAADSCAKATSPAYWWQAQVWIWGYWSGLNSLNPTTGTVGQTTDAYGVAGEVRKVCEGEPSLDLTSATVRAYNKMAAERR